MTNNTTDPKSGEPSRLPDDLTQLVTFLSEESNRNRSALWDQIEANRDSLANQAEEDRRLLKHTLWIVSIPLSLVLVIAGVVGWKDLNSIEDHAHRSLDAVVQQNRDAISAAQIQNNRALAEVQSLAAATLKTEADMADKRLQEKFSDKNVQETIDGAAKIATEGKAKELIEERVETMIEPIQKKAEASFKAIHIQELILKVKDTGDVKSNNELLSLFYNGTSEEQRQIRLSLPEFNTSSRLNAPLSKDCIIPQSVEFTNAMRSPNYQVRMETLRSCQNALSLLTKLTSLEQQRPSIALAEEFVPALLKIAVSDNSLFVQDKARGMLNSFFMGLPEYPENGYQGRNEVPSIEEWWRTHEPDYEALVVLKFTNSNKYNHDGKTITDLTYLYDFLKPFENYKSPALAQQFKQIREQMRLQAIKIDNSEIDFAIEHEELTCENVEDRASNLGQPGSASPDAEDFRLEPLKFLLKQKCPLNARFLKFLVDVALTTDHLSMRFAAITILRAWKGLRFDPFDDTPPLRDWWKRQPEAGHQ